jgi:hypothetical protein
MESDNETALFGVESVGRPIEEQDVRHSGVISIDV